MNRGGLLWRLLDLPLGPGAARVAKVLGVLFGLAAPVAIALMCAAAYGLFSRRGDYFGMLQVFFQYAFWPETVALLILTMTWHELGHLTAAHRYGSRASRVGAGLYLFMPSAFIRIDDFFMISKRWQRVVVALGGVYFDLISMSNALLVWTYSPNYSQASQVALVISYVLLTRILFNVLPFLRLDGYWAFSEAIGVRKLRDESLKSLMALIPGLAKIARPSPRFGKRARFAMAFYGLATTALFIGSLLWSYRYFANLLAGWSPDYALALKVGLAITMVALVVTSLLRDFGRALGFGFRRA
jgi:putative peptide zinc metalloprotease protein